MGRAEKEEKPAKPEVDCPDDAPIEDDNIITADVVAYKSMPAYLVLIREREGKPWEPFGNITSDVNEANSLARSRAPQQACVIGADLPI